MDPIEGLDLKKVALLIMPPFFLGFRVFLCSVLFFFCNEESSGDPDPFFFSFLSRRDLEIETLFPAAEPRGNALIYTCAFGISLGTLICTRSRLLRLNCPRLSNRRSEFATEREGSRAGMNETRHLNKIRVGQAVVHLS